jgi:hypothetical protein
MKKILMKNWKVKGGKKNFRTFPNAVLSKSTFPSVAYLSQSKRNDLFHPFSANIIASPSLQAKWSGSSIS